MYANSFRASKNASLNVKPSSVETRPQDRGLQRRKHLRQQESPTKFHSNHNEQTPSTSPPASKPVMCCFRNHTSSEAEASEPSAALTSDKLLHQTIISTTRLPQTTLHDPPTQTTSHSQSPITSSQMLPWCSYVPSKQQYRAKPSQTTFPSTASPPPASCKSKPTYQSTRGMV